MRPLVLEMRWAFSWEAVAVGVGIFALWVGLDPFYPHLMKSGATGNPGEQFGEGSALMWFFIAVHILGMTFIVPPLEEVFYRSFLYRYFANQNFLSVPLDRFAPWPFLATAIVFGLSHNEWLGGILCGAAYQWLVIRKHRLGDAMTAHATTNFLLGAWIVCAVRGTSGDCRHVRERPITTNSSRESVAKMNSWMRSCLAARTSPG